MLVLETIAGQDIDLGIAACTKTHASGGVLNEHQVSLSTFSLAGASGTATTATWAPGAIAAGGQATTTITVQGAALGDKVLLSHDGVGTAALILVGHVSVANTVCVVMANLTSAAVTPTSGTLSVLVFRHR
jgi:hypothetical protein